MNPDQSAESLYEEYLVSPWSEPSRREREFLDAGEPLAATLPDGTTVFGRRWRPPGDSRGTVLLAHGWAGRSATWLVLVPLLLAAGYDAVAFDAPGHGETRAADAETRSHFFLFAATLLAAQKALGEDRPFVAIVGHSFGASVFPYALNRGFRAERAILIAPTARVESLLPRWADARGLAPDRVSAIRALWIAEFGAEILASTDPVVQVAHATTPALILHDVGDVEVPVEDGRELARTWPGAVFEATTGLGHRRILLSRAAMERIVDSIRA